jgi:hypothetical protein
VEGVERGERWKELREADGGRSKKAKCEAGGGEVRGGRNSLPSLMHQDDGRHDLMLLSSHRHCTSGRVVFVECLPVVQMRKTVCTR